MKIVSYNVNGLRSAINKGLVEWLQDVKADVVCLQEIKCSLNDVSLFLFEELGYLYNTFHSAQKKGYSGVAILSKLKPNNIKIGCDIEIYDAEGRILQYDFETFSVINVYMPSGSSGDVRQAFKYSWMKDFYKYISTVLVGIKSLVVCGDYNICHQAIDIHNPKANANSSGFLPEERAWLTELLKLGFLDIFRQFNQEPHQYTWWTFRAGARSKNLGWRIDYFLISQALIKRSMGARILADAMHSDHCPVLYEMNN